MANLKELGLSINDDLIEEVNKLEEEIIKNEILPVLTEKIEPALSVVKRELVLVVDYVPNNPISVRISRKRNFTAEIPDAKVIAIDPEVEHAEHGQINYPVVRTRRTCLSVTFPDGTTISEQNAVETLHKVILKIGVEKVRRVVEQYQLKFCRVLVISNRRDRKYGHTQRDLGNGWLLMTHSNNPMKRDFLNKISDYLNLNLIIHLREV